MLPAKGGHLGGESLSTYPDWHFGNHQNLGQLTNQCQLFRYMTATVHMISDGILEGVVIKSLLLLPASDSILDFLGSFSCRFYRSSVNAFLVINFL